MKKFKFVTFIMMLAVLLCGGILTANAASTLPNSVLTDYLPGYSHGLREVEYIKNFPVIVKTTDNGKYYVYCMNLSATYAGNVEFTKTGVVDDGYLFILKNRPKTDNKDRDFYITQMAVWYYDDYLSGKDFNLVKEVKEYIVSNVKTDEVARYIYNLYKGAKKYKQTVGTLSLSKDPVSVTVKDGYYVSSKIKVNQANLNSNIKYSLTNAPIGSQVVKVGEDTIKVKVPVNQIPEGKQLTVNLNVESTYNHQTGYYYFKSGKAPNGMGYQKVLFQDALDENIAVKDTRTVVFKHYKENHEVTISKTDITQSKEVPGATLEVKDKDGKVINTWVSGNEPHKITLKAGNYSLTETIAPQGYKLSKTTIEFMVDNAGSVFVKGDSGKYIAVNKVVLINELVDVVSFAKKNSVTGEYVSEAILAIKDEQGNLVKEFKTSNTVYQLSLDAGKYTLQEVKAPEGYLFSKEIVKFELLSDGTLKVMNNKGEYVDSVMITFYNTPEENKEVIVPITDKSSTLLIIGGLALIIGGIACAKKTIKEC